MNSAYATRFVLLNYHRIVWVFKRTNRTHSNWIISTLTYFDLHRAAQIHSKSIEPYVCCCRHIFISMCMWCDACGFCVWFLRIYFAVASDLLFRSSESKETILHSPNQLSCSFSLTFREFTLWHLVPKYTKPSNISMSNRVFH